VLSLFGLILVFAVAKFNAPRAMVYQRNNLAALAAAALAGMSFYLWGWIGLLAFVGGSAIGAAEWASEVREANERVNRTVVMRPQAPAPSPADQTAQAARLLHTRAHGGAAQARD
jgi:hypothetical protein